MCVTGARRSARDLDLHKGRPDDRLANLWRGGVQTRHAARHQIGDILAAVRKAYGDEEDRIRDRSGDHLVAGSIYGAVFIDPKGGSVTLIFIGLNGE